MKCEEEKKISVEPRSIVILERKDKVQKELKEDLKVKEKSKCVDKTKAKEKPVEQINKTGKEEEK